MEVDTKTNGEKKTDNKTSNGARDEADASVISNSSEGASRARMPVERNAPYYNMNHKNRGMAVIFNHEKFSIPNLNPRTGTSVDSDSLTKCLKGLGFSVTVFNDPTFGQILNCIQDTAKKDHSDSDCILIAVMTHGELGMLYAKDTYFKPENLWLPFTGDKCPTLAGKPKLFFIQACQGEQLDAGQTLYKSETDGTSIASYKIPVFADFLIVYSTVPGYLSWRDVSRGSWFMQALCEVLQSYNSSDSKENILDLLTTVSRKVALDYESDTPGRLFTHQQKQIPFTTSMLTRLLVFGKKLKN